MKLVHGYGLKPEFVTPYSPEQNGAIERFMRTLKEGCIRLNSFTAFREAKSAIGSWIGEYNTDRPHHELGYPAPAEYREKLAAELVLTPGGHYSDTHNPRNLRTGATMKSISDT
jgi:putative transposase